MARARGAVSFRASMEGCTRGRVKVWLWEGGGGSNESRKQTIR